MIVSGHPAEAGEPGAEESAQPMKDVQHNPGDAPHTGVNLEKSRLVGGKADVWRGLQGTYTSDYSEATFNPRRCKVCVESKSSLRQFQTSKNVNFFKPIQALVQK